MNPMSDVRSRRLVVVAHCLLNQNAKVAGVASHPGVFAPLVPLLLDAGVGVIQMPCPEMAHLGPSRPLGSDTVEQYDTPGYREVCLTIARTTVSGIAAYHQAGYEVMCVLGVEGSPSCSVSRVPRLAPGGEARLERGTGLFMGALAEEMAAVGLEIPCVGVPEAEQAGDLRSALVAIENLLQGPSQGARTEPVARS